MQLAAGWRHSMNKRLRDIRHVALDMDGTIYSGGTLFESTRPFLALLAELGIGHTFLTNNSSKSAKDYLAHLRKIGIAATADQLYTSTQATIEYLRQRMPAVRRLFVLGTASMSRELDGCRVCADGRQRQRRTGWSAGWVRHGPDVRAALPSGLLDQQGKPFIATHPDRVCPTDQPTVLVDCGAICAALKEATGRAPDVVLGKPDPCMLRGILSRHALAPEQLAMVGDRFYTDMAMAHRAGRWGCWC